MASIIKPLMSGESTPWMLYLGGAVLAFILDKLKVPALAFALGMFIPLQLNTPLLVGGAIAWYVTTRSKDEKVNNARKERGTLIASGLIAGGAIMGVVSAILRFANFDFFMTEWAKSAAAEYLGIGMFALLCFYLIWDTKRAKVEETETVTE
jgi:hypothetical protein